MSEIKGRLEYREAPLAVLVLDFLKEEETRLCLESVKRHVKVEHTVIYHHNGQADYPVSFLREGLVDQLIQTKENHGLGLGTRALFAAAFSPISFYLQNDQFLVRDFNEEDLNGMEEILCGEPPSEQPRICSISLAGAPCGDGVYSERGHLILTDLYREWEHRGMLGCHGAGPYHDGPWRESQIQQLYRDCDCWHMIWPQPFVQDNGRRAIRENPDGSLWEHQPDVKRLWLLRGPVKERHVYPRLSEREWSDVIAHQNWEPGKIPEMEVGESFHVWN